MSMFIIGCQIVYMMLIAFFMVREIIRFRQQGTGYWNDKWNLVDIIIFILSWATLALYVIREGVGRHLLHLLKDKGSFDYQNIY